MLEHKLDNCTDRMEHQGEWLGADRVRRFCFDKRVRGVSREEHWPGGIRSTLPGFVCQRH